MAFSPFQINNLRRESEEVAKAKFNEFPKEGEIIQEKIAISKHFKVCASFHFIVYLSRNKQTYILFSYDHKFLQILSFSGPNICVNLLYFF